MSVHIQSVLTATSYDLKKLVKYSTGFKEKLKRFGTLPILPTSIVNRAELRHEIRENGLIPALTTIKNGSFLFFRCIFGLRLAYLVP